MNRQNNSPDSIPHYDSHIIPAESAARQKREGKHFLHTHHDRANSESSHTTDGYTVDRDGLVNNYGIEPEIYVNTPGDLRQQTAREAARSRQLQELSEDEKGKLTVEHDLRHKGQGMI